MLQAESIWDPSWLHVGMVLGPKLDPKWHENALKTESTTHKNDHIVDRLRIDFGSILDRFWKKFQWFEEMFDSVSVDFWHIFEYFDSKHSS